MPRFREIKPRRLIYLLLPLLALFVYMLLPKNEEVRKKPASASPQARQKFNNFILGDLSIVEKEGDNIIFTIAAGQVVHRKRTSELFVFQNLKELYMSGVRIDIYSRPAGQASGGGGLYIPLKEMGQGFMSLGKPATAPEDYLEGRARADLDLLTRLLIEDLEIDIHLPGKPVSIRAQKARLNTDFRNLVLDGPVRLRTAGGLSLSASGAVWSQEFNGIYFPNGYIMGGEFCWQKAFFTIDSGGVLRKSDRVPGLEYGDLIDQREEELLDQVKKKIPALRFVLGQGKTPMGTREQSGHSAPPKGL